MAKVNGSSMAVPASPPMPGTMPSTRPMMQPSPRNIRRCGSIRVTKALPAAAAMKATSPEKPSITRAPLRSGRAACAVLPSPRVARNRVSEGCRSGRPFPCWRRLKQKIAGCGSGLAAAWAGTVIHRHPEVLGAPFVRQASKGDGPGRSSFEARRAQCGLLGYTAKCVERLRMTVPRPPHAARLPYLMRFSFCFSLRGGSLNRRAALPPRMLCFAFSERNGRS